MPVRKYCDATRKVPPCPRGSTIVQALVVLALSMLSSQITYPEQDPHVEGIGLKVISFNTWFGLDGKGIFQVGECESEENREKRYEGLVAGLLRYDPDVVFIQEANPLPRYVRRLAKDLDMDEIHALNNGGIRIGSVGIPANLRLGNAILAKHELKLQRVGTFRTSGRGIVSDHFCFHLSEVRILLAGAVYPSGQPLYLFCLHTHASVPDTETSRAELKELLDAQGVKSTEFDDYASRLSSGFARTGKDILQSIRYIEKVTHGNSPFIVAGDFNAYPSDFPYMREFMARLQLVDSFGAANPGQPGYTWDPSRNPSTACDAAEAWADGETKGPLELLEAKYAGTVPQRIDYIFLSNHFAPADVMSSKVVFTEPYDDIYVSDHFGVMTEVSFKKQYPNKR